MYYLINTNCGTPCMYHFSILKAKYLQVRKNLMLLRDKKGSNDRLNLEKISFSNRYTTVNLIETCLQLSPACHHICSSLLLNKAVLLQKTLVSFFFFLSFLYSDLLFFEITEKPQEQIAPAPGVLSALVQAFPHFCHYGGF